MASFRPLEACIGGLFIGVACGTYMLLAGRIAGNSGALKSIILGPREPTKLAFAGGLIIGGVLIKRLLPTAFEVSPAPTLLLAIAGLATGVGTAMSNGCTSGHGLCGLSRFSLRSLAAVPTFMAVAIAVSTANSGGVVGKMLPIAATPPATLSLAAWLAVGLAAALPPCALLPAKSVLKETYAGLWCGACFAFGLGLGGMVRPSVVTNALAPASFDATLWVLFMTALATTFVAYRVAARAGVGAASTWGAATPAKVDAPLLIGSALFGVGWGLSGLCPGPLIVGLAADPAAPGPLLVLATVSLGMLFARPLGRATSLIPSDAAAELSDVDEVKAAMYELAATAEVTLVDLRPLSSSEATGPHKRFEAVVGALSAPWDAATASLPLGGLPQDKSQTLVLFCRSGNRAKKAAAYLRSKGYSKLLNAGGPEGPPALWKALDFGRRHHAHNLAVFAQLFDGPTASGGGGSSTLTYLLGDVASGEAILIDPVLEQVERDLAEISRLGLKLVLALNTHCHADHVTGTGQLKKRVPGLQSVISKASTACADRYVKPNDLIEWAGGKRTLRVLGTPGHTNGCVSFFDDAVGAVFSGDALFINGCGRTDFQEGSAATLWESVTRQLFTLPDTTLVLPAHDYKGRRHSTIKHERDANERFALGRDGFVKHMAELQLPYPKKLDVSLPANLKCGLD